jgi:hypothetical protein
MWCTNCQTPFDWVSGLELKNVVVHNPHYFLYLQNTNGGIIPRNPNDILCGGMPDLGKFRLFVATQISDKDLLKFITTNVYNIYRFIGHVQHLLRNDITRQFESGIELARIKHILNIINEKEFKDDVYKHYTLRNKRNVNNRLIDTVNVVGIDIIQRYIKAYDSKITLEASYDLTYKLIKEYCAIIDYFNGLQEEKTNMFKERGVRIIVNNNGTSDLHNGEIIPFHHVTNNPQLNFHVLGTL